MWIVNVLAWLVIVWWPPVCLYCILPLSLYHHTWSTSITVSPQLVSMVMVLINPTIDHPYKSLKREWLNLMQLKVLFSPIVSPWTTWYLISIDASMILIICPSFNLYLHGDFLDGQGKRGWSWFDLGQRKGCFALLSSFRCLHPMRSILLYSCDWFSADALYTILPNTTDLGKWKGIHNNTDRQTWTMDLTAMMSLIL